MLELRTLGGLKLLAGGELVRTHRVRETAILAYLACFQSRQHSRAELAQMFWPRASSRNALHCLSQSLYRLTTEVHGLRFDADGKTVGIAAGLLHVDVLEFRRLLQAKRHRDAWLLYGGPFLDGFAVDGAPDFEEWLESARREVANQAEDMFRVVMQEAESVGEWGHAQAAAHALLELNPYDDTAAATEIALLAAAGEPARAKARLSDALAALSAIGRRPSAKMLEVASALDREELSPFAGPDFLPLVGRSREFGTVRALLNDTVVGRGGGALILGKAGIGKTKLAEQATRLAALRGLRILSCVGSPALQESVYAGTRELFAGINAAELSGLPATQLEVLSRLLSRDAHSDTVKDVAPVPRDWVYSAVAGVLEHMAKQRPLLIAVEDVQWLDAASLGLLQFVMRGISASRIAVIATARPDELQLAAGDTLPGCVSILLSELPKPAVDELIAAFCAKSGAALPSSATEAIRKMAGGHPFFLLELLKRFLAGEHSPRSPGDQIDRFMAMRLNSLCTTARRIADALAVLGNCADRGLLASVAQVSESEFADGIDELIRRGLIRDDHDGVSFLHDLMREGTYWTLSETRRRMLHTRTARAPLLISTGDLCRLAFHANLAGSRPMAWRFATAAARMTEKRYGMTEAERYWRLAADNAVEDSHRLVAKERLCDCHYMTTNDEEASKLLDELLADHRLPVSKRLCYEARRIGIAARTNADIEEAACSRIIEEADQLGSPEELAEVFQPLIVAFMLTGREERIDTCAARVVAALGDPRPSANIARFLRSLGEFSALSGKMAECEHYLSLAERCYDPRRPHERSLVRAIAAEKAFLMGRLQAADDLFRAALEAVDGDFDRLDPAAQGNWALVKLEQGKFEESQALLDATIRRATRLNHLGQLTIGMTNKAALELERGDMKAAASLARQVLGICAHRRILFRCPAGVYGLSIMDSDREEALRLAADLRKDETHRLGDDLSYVEIFLARVSEASGHVKKALTRLDHFAEYYRDRDSFCLGRIQLEQARLLGKFDRDAALMMARDIRVRALDAGAVLLLNKAEALIMTLRRGDARCRSSGGPGGSATSKSR